MSERLLEAFREEAEQHARVPAFETIAAPGAERSWGPSRPASSAPAGRSR